jgi:hypothetical protein
VVLARGAYPYPRASASTTGPRHTPHTTHQPDTRHSAAQTPASPHSASPAPSHCSHARQVRRPDFPVFELFNAAWCVRTPQPTRGTQPRLRCSVVGLLRAPPAPRLRFCRGSASCAFPARSPTRFGLLVATKPHTSGGLAALRVPGGEGVIVPFSGGFAGLIIKVVDYFSSKASRSIFLVCANWL